MHAPKPDDQAQTAWVILKRIYDGRVEIFLEGDEGHLVSLIAQSFAAKPELLECFEKALRYYRLYKSKMN